jgi:putative tryptophan/tyrosine transport system substrate-binding protein
MQFDRLRRREFLTLLGGAAAWPLAARAQMRKRRIIGFLGSGTYAAQGLWVTAFLQRLRELGYRGFEPRRFRHCRSMI